MYCTNNALEAAAAANQASRVPDPPTHPSTGVATASAGLQQQQPPLIRSSVPPPNTAVSWRMPRRYLHYTYPPRYHPAPVDHQFSLVPRSLLQGGPSVPVTMSPYNAENYPLVPRDFPSCQQQQQQLELQQQWNLQQQHELQKQASTSTTHHHKCTTTKPPPLVKTPHDLHPFQVSNRLVPPLPTVPHYYSQRADSSTSSSTSKGRLRSQDKTTLVCSLISQDGLSNKKQHKTNTIPDKASDTAVSCLKEPSPPNPTPTLPSNTTTTKPSKDAMLDILCSTALDLGKLQESHSGGCGCTNNRCLKLYCACFKAGRMCDPTVCKCKDCHNHPIPERVQAIKALLERQPHAFTRKRTSLKTNACHCRRSACLKLYCVCFANQRVCTDECWCVDCGNTRKEKEKVGGRRYKAIRAALEKDPQAFTKTPKEIGNGCACKNNRCLKKYW